MTIVINLGLHTGCIGGIFITGIFGNFYTKRGGIFDFQNGNSRWPCLKPWPCGLVLVMVLSSKPRLSCVMCDFLQQLSVNFLQNTVNQPLHSVSRA